MFSKNFTVVAVYNWWGSGYMVLYSIMYCKYGANKDVSGKTDHCMKSVFIDKLSKNNN